MNKEFKSNLSSNIKKTYFTIRLIQYYYSQPKCVCIHRERTNEELNSKQKQANKQKKLLSGYFKIKKCKGHNPNLIFKEDINKYKNKKFKQSTII